MIWQRVLPASEIRVAVENAATFVQQHWALAPRAGIILGTGLGNLVQQLELDVAIPYSDIPGFPRSTAVGHRGQFVCGSLAGVPVVAMDGRFHFYEGYPADQVTLPVRVMRALGAELIVVSNASGGVNPLFCTGDLMVIVGHINLMGSRSAGADASDRTIPSRSPSGSPYDPQLIDMALATSRRCDFVCHRGVYLSVLGPNYETRAEYRMIRRLGADAVGMSTTPEVLVAAQSGMRVLALSTIANIAKPDAPTRVDAQDVIAASSTAEPHLRQIIVDVLTNRNCGTL